MAVDLSLNCPTWLRILLFLDEDPETILFFTIFERRALLSRWFPALDGNFSEYASNQEEWGKNKVISTLGLSGAHPTRKSLPTVFYVCSSAFPAPLGGYLPLVLFWVKPDLSNKCSEVIVCSGFQQAKQTKCMLQTASSLQKPLAEISIFLIFNIP